MSFGHDLKELFGTISSKEYALNKEREIEAKIHCISEDEISSGDLEGCLKNFIEKYFPKAICFDESKIETNIRKEMLPDNSSGDNYYKDGFVVEFTIPFYGSEELFEVIPSKQYLHFNFVVKNFIAPSGDDPGNFVIEKVFAVDELPGDTDSNRDYVNKKFNETFEKYRDMADCVNAEVIRFLNGSVKEKVRSLLKKTAPERRGVVRLGDCPECTTYLEKRCTKYKAYYFDSAQSGKANS